ncbi:MAG: hypothetical protein K5871_07950 [Lachnospiraceae bacterium]|nr:hypothetical protein [Lachnospiraceae bacterium]
MMHLEYKKLDYKGCHIDIQPDHKSDIPRLREMVTNNLNIKNPSKIFSERVKSGEYDDRSEESLEAEAKVVNALADLWHGEYSMNVLMLLSRAMQEIVDLKVK